jgi:hypothetical protein
MGKLSIAQFATFYTTRRQNHERSIHQSLAIRFTILGARIAKFGSHSEPSTTLGDFDALLY